MDVIIELPKINDFKKSKWISSTSTWNACTMESRFNVKNIAYIMKI